MTYNNQSDGFIVAHIFERTDGNKEYSNQANAGAER